MVQQRKQHFTLSVDQRLRTAFATIATAIISTTTTAAAATTTTTTTITTITITITITTITTTGTISTRCGGIVPKYSSRWWRSRWWSWLKL